MRSRHKLTIAMTAALVTLAAPAAYAQTKMEASSELDLDLIAPGLPVDTHVGPRSRADVMAELDEARSQGLLDDTSSGPSPQVLARREARNAEQYQQIVAANEQAEQERLAAAEQQSREQQEQQISMAEPSASSDASTAMMSHDEYRAAYSNYVGDSSYMGPAANPAVTEPVAQ